MPEQLLKVSRSVIGIIKNKIYPFVTVKDVFCVLLLGPNHYENMTLKITLKSLTALKNL